MKKLTLLLMLLSIVAAEEFIINDFQHLTANLTVLPKSPPLIFSPAAANTIGKKRALRITSLNKENPPIIRYQLPENTAAIPTPTALSFFVKTDTASEVYVALEDEKIMTPFENISFCVPDRAIRKYWQRAILSLEDSKINKKNIKNIYFKIIAPAKVEKSVVYLDSIHYLTSGNIIPAKVAEPLYDFNVALANKFSAEPQVRLLPSASFELRLTAQGHYGTSGRSLEFVFHNPNPQAGELVLPLLKNSYPLQTSQENITWMMRTEKVFKYTVRIIYRADQSSKKNLEPFYAKEYEITFPDTFWHQLKLPLERNAKNSLIGIVISIPGNSAGTLYLDDLGLI